MAPDILLFCERKKWHGRRVAQALKARGLEPLTVPLGACGLTTATKTGLAIPGLGDRLPKGALVLFVPGGSVEQVTLYLGVLHALRELGVTVWNDARAIERCVDKSTTTFFLQRVGIPTPWTWTGGSRHEALAVAKAKLAEGHKLVQKPLFGAQGEGLRLIERVEDLAPEEEVAGAYYLQEFVAREDGPYCDWRLFVSGGPSWITWAPGYAPWQRRARARLGYATGAQAFRLEAQLEQHWQNSPVWLRLDGLASGVEVLRFYGYGRGEYCDWHRHSFGPSPNL